MAVPEVITPYADPDELLSDTLDHWQRILGTKRAGVTYTQNLQA